MSQLAPLRATTKRDGEASDSRVVLNLLMGPSISALRLFEDEVAVRQVRQPKRSESSEHGKCQLSRMALSFKFVGDVELPRDVLITQRDESLRLG